jgi:hypothetical protein
MSPYGPAGYGMQLSGFGHDGGIPHDGVHQQPFANGHYGMGPGQASHYGSANMQPQLFQNPLQPEDKHGFSPYEKGGVPPPYPLPHQPNHFPKPPPGQFASILNSFKSESGTLDINKMVNTAGQMMNALTQLSAMAKGLGGLFKG